MQTYDTRIPVGARFRRGALAVNEWCEMNRIEPGVLDDNSGERMVPEVGDGDSVRGDYAGHLPGVVRP